MANEQIRAFVAIELPDELKSRMKDYQAEFKITKHDFVKWVGPGSMHLTLKFLANVSLNRLEDVKNEIKNAAESSSSFSLITCETGCFPNLKKVRVFWLGLNGDIAKLLDLQRMIDESLVKLGFSKESRPFTAHLTLARLKDDCTIDDRKEFSELIKEAKFEPPFSMIVGRISLIRSQLTSGGAVYTRLAEFKLPDYKSVNCQLIDFDCSICHIILINDILYPSLEEVEK